MPLLVSDIHSQVRILVNDAAGSWATDDKILPLTKSAHRQIQRRMRSSGLPLARELSGPITVPPNTDILTGLTDMIQPISVERRAVGGTENDWVEISEQEFDIAGEPQPSIDYWNYREEEIKLQKSTGTWQLRVQYWKSHTTISGVNSTIPITEAEDFMIYRVAAQASRFLGENPERADQLDAQAELFLQEVIANSVKARQNLRVRRKPFNWRGR